MKQIILAIMFIISFSTGIVQASESPKEQYLCEKTTTGNLSCKPVEIQMTSKTEPIEKLNNDLKTSSDFSSESIVGGMGLLGLAFVVLFFFVIVFIGLSLSRTSSNPSSSSSSNSESSNRRTSCWG